MMRLTHLPTLRVNPAEKLSLIYRGKKYQGLKGDSVATALWANNIRIFSRSLKYHRPRGLYSLDGESGNTFMQVDGIPNVCAETTFLRDGMRVADQNVKGSARFDLMGFMDKLDAFMPAGFYYRTLHKPPAVWPIALKQIRKAAGPGRLSPDFTMKGTFDEIYLNADICVIGGGPAGMRSALAAAESELRIILLESRPYLGGHFDYRVQAFNTGQKLYQRARELAEQVHRTENIRVFHHTSVTGVYGNHQVTAFQVGKKEDGFDQRYLEVGARSIVVATGCIERPLLFEHNERPGVMQVGCAHRLARTYGLLPGTTAVFSVGHDLGLEAAVDLYDQGLDIACVADLRRDGVNPILEQALNARGIPFYKGWGAAKAHGGKTVDGVTSAAINGTSRRRFSCDLIVASAGLTPVNGPLVSAQADLTYDFHTGYFLPQNLPLSIFTAGRTTGRNNPLAIEASGSLAGYQAAEACGKVNHEALATSKRALSDLPGPDQGSSHVMPLKPGRKIFICFDEDTTTKHINQAIEMGFDVPELIKRFTSAGTGPGQGGIPGHNLPLYAARYTSAAIPPKPTTVRPPLVPAYLATYAGAHHDMCKRTPLHDSQAAAGGIFRRIGVWQRARYFSTDFSCREEVLNVRNNVGMLDSSTLGKFRIHGPDALKALQRVYVSDMTAVNQGRVKYSAMCNNDGCVIDDGVIIKTGNDDYYFTTSTGRAGETVEWIRYHTRYDNWDFHLVNLTDAMGVINISGPYSRKVLEKLVDTDISNEAFPFGGYREFTVHNHIPIKALRLGFVGELSYELHVGSSWTQALWDLLETAGKPFGIRNFGVEAQNILRMEKGHIILGQESEQRTNLLDLGLGFLWDGSKSEAKTVGAVALRQAKDDSDRLKLVGFRMQDNIRAPKDGSIIVDHRVRGYVCTARESFTSGEAIGMALVEAFLSGIGTRLAIFEDECKGRLRYAEVVGMPFYDPDGRRMRI